MGFWDLGDHFPDRPEPAGPLRIVTLHEREEEPGDSKNPAEGFRVKPQVLRVVLPERPKKIR